MRRRSGVYATIGLITMALVLAGCDARPGAAGDPPAPQDFSACMVTDTGGINDKSFNTAAWNAMRKVQTEVKAKVQYLQSTSESDYAPNIRQFIVNDCDLIVTVGGLMQQATYDSAQVNPTQHFVEVDAPGNGHNVQGLEYDTAQCGFLAGYLAAGYSRTGKVATFGGMNIPSVTIYMDGFWEGVKYYNRQRDASVQVLGWSENSRNGTFTDSFSDTDRGDQVATTFVQQGADVLFTVAGGSGLGAEAVAQSSAGKVAVIWVDSDGVVADPQYSDVFLTSAYKNIGDAVTRAVESAVEGKFAPTNYVGTLANGGVGLAPFHDFESKVPAQLRTDLNQIEQGIIAGTIKITSSSQPAP